MGWQCVCVWGRGGDLCTSIFVCRPGVYSGVGSAETDSCIMFISLWLDPPSTPPIHPPTPPAPPTPKKTFSTHFQRCHNPNMGRKNTHKSLPSLQQQKRGWGGGGWEEGDSELIQTVHGKNTDAQVCDLDWGRQQCTFFGICFLTEVKQTQAFVAWASGDIINCGNCGPPEQPWPPLTWVPRQWSQSAWPRQKWGRSRWCRTWRWTACCCARGPCRSERSWLSSEADHQVRTQVHTHVTHSK